jgi:hypothetical protein
VSVDLLRLALATLAGGGVIAAVAGSTRPIVAANLPSARVTGPDAAASSPDSIEPGMLARAIERPVFRADRKPARVAYDAARAEEPESPPPSEAPKPSLAVSGILWGAEPAALVEGFPGIEGSLVVRKGDSVGGLRVLRIDRERVVIQGMGTTWRLGVRNPWP